MSLFKAGDLALVVECKLVPENVGCVVELIQHLRKDEEYLAPDRIERYADAECWLVQGRVRGLSRKPDGTIISTYGHACFQERRLMPLRGDFAPDREKCREVPA